MVSAADPRAAAAGTEILREGGSAADAAFATLLALNVVEPQSSGIGGGGYLVYSERGGPAVTFDGREKAPAAATGTWFYKNGQPMEFDDAQPGGKSVGVPGNIRMMALAHQRYGKVPWAALFQPAIKLAREGFKVSRSDLELTADVPDLDEAKLRDLAEEAKKNCPISKLLNADMELTVHAGAEAAA